MEYHNIWIERKKIVERRREKGRMRGERGGGRMRESRRSGEREREGGAGRERERQ